VSTEPDRFMSHGKRDVLFKRLAYGWLGSLTLKVCGMILGLVSTILLARYLGVTGYGLYSYAIVLVTLISMPAILGVPTLVTRETASANEARNWGQMRGLWRWSGRISLILVTVALALATSVLYFTNNHIAHADKVVIYIAMMMTPLLVMGRLRSAALRGLKSPVLAQMPEQFIRQTCFFESDCLVSYWFRRRASNSRHRNGAKCNFSVFCFFGWRNFSLQVIANID